MRKVTVFHPITGERKAVNADKHAFDGGFELEDATHYFRPGTMYMHSQRDPKSRDIHLGNSSATIGGFGCFVTGCAYLASIALKRDVEPLELVNYLNSHAGFTPGGLLIWDKIRLFTYGKLQMYSTWNPVGKSFTGRVVSFAGQTHFVVELQGGKLIYDPWSWPPEPFIKPISAYPRLIGRRYFKITS